MTRPLTIQFPDAWYHVMNRGKRGEQIFPDKKDYYAFIAVIKDCVEMWNIRVVAYVLMGTHASSPSNSCFKFIKMYETY